MKNLRFVVALLAVVPAAALAQEGVATFRYTMGSAGGQSDGQSRVYFTKNAYRAEIQMNFASMRGDKQKRPATAESTYKTAMIMRASEPDKLYSVNDETRSYSVMDLAEIRKYAPRSEDTWRVKKLGSDRVAGVSCEKASLTSSNGAEMELCVAKDLVASSRWWVEMNRQQRDSGMWFKALHDAGVEGMPVRWKMHSKEGQDMLMELLNLERKSVPASTFEIPAGYRQTSVGMGGMTPQQEKKMRDALSKMTPEQRKAYEDAMKGQQKKQ